MYVAYVSSRSCKSKSGVAYVTMAIHVCYKYMFQMFSCFKHMLQVFYLDVACYGSYTYMLQVCFPNVSSVLSGCCMFSSGCCICYSSYTHMLQVYVLNV
jgi:hypothetical protein